MIQAAVEMAGKAKINIRANKILETKYPYTINQTIQ
jgi:hypothetical protein